MPLRAVMDTKVLYAALLSRLDASFEMLQCLTRGVEFWQPVANWLERQNTKAAHIVSLSCPVGRIASSRFMMARIAKHTGLKPQDV